jgi:hypothetical protein
MNTVNPNAASTRTGNTVESREILLKDIGAKWSKFSEQELGALKSKDDLISQLGSKYSLDKAQAQRDVDAVINGRQL